MINGARVSRPQRELNEILGGKLNVPVAGYVVDIGLQIEGTQIAVEYDSWFWHGYNQAYDQERDEMLIAAGWRVLRVKSNNLLPSEEATWEAIKRLIDGEMFVEIILEDWGVGPTFEEARTQAAASNPWMQLDFWNFIEG